MTPQIAIASPLAGVVRPLSEVPDPVFAQELVGPGLAVDPPRELVQVYAPVAGTIVKLHPHAFVIAGTGVAVLVHCGIDTVQLHGEGFTLHATERDLVDAGALIVSFDAGLVESSGRSPMVPVVALEADPRLLIPSVESGHRVLSGDPLFRLRSS